jgi:hypothetical protein
MGKYSRTPASDLYAPWLDLLSCQIQMRNSTGADLSFIAALSERGLMLVENRKGNRLTPNAASFRQTISDLKGVMVPPLEETARR